MNIYFVLNIPAPASRLVMEVRRAHKDVYRVSLPVEVTVAGSNGLGVLEETEDLSKAYSILDRIAADTAPIETAFGPVVRFAGTNVFALTFEHDAPLRELHARIAHSGLRFRSSPHAFTPHCTLRSRAPITAADERELLALRIPGRFTLDSISVCGLDRPLDPVVLLHTAVFERRATSTLAP